MRGLLGEIRRPTRPSAPSRRFMPAQSQLQAPAAGIPPLAAPATPTTSPSTTWDAQEPGTRPQAEQVLLQFRQSPRPFATCQHILQHSQSLEAKFHAACAMREALVREWALLSAEELLSLRSYMLQYIMQHAPDASMNVVGPAAPGPCCCTAPRPVSAAVHLLECPLLGRQRQGLQQCHKLQQCCLRPRPGAAARRAAPLPLASGLWRRPWHLGRRRSGRSSPARLPCCSSGAGVSWPWRPRRPRFSRWRLLQPPPRPPLPSAPASRSSTPCCRNSRWVQVLGGARYMCGAARWRWVLLLTAQHKQLAGWGAAAGQAHGRVLLGAQHGGWLVASAVAAAAAAAAAGACAGRGGAGQAPWQAPQRGHWEALS
jgi:hypothetical protein